MGTLMRSDDANNYLENNDEESDVKVIEKKNDI